MGKFVRLLASTLMLCVAPLVHAQDARQEPQHKAPQAAPRTWAPIEDDASTQADAMSQADTVSRASGLSAATPLSSKATPAISEVRDSFKIYPAVVGARPLPTNGVWSVPITHTLAFLPACKEWKASCLEVEYSVTSRKIVCRWTVLFPAPIELKGKEVQTPTVINEDGNAAQYTMMVRLQTGMKYAPVATQAPVYPAKATAKDWTGSVSLDIIVSPQGKVVSIPGVRGPTLLQPSARQAVARWEYGATRLGSQNVARSFTVQVNYGVGGETIRRH